MTELPRKAAVRTARLAALPLGYAGRQALGFGGGFSFCDVAPPAQGPSGMAM